VCTIQACSENFAEESAAEIFTLLYKTGYKCIDSVHMHYQVSPIGLSVNPFKDEAQTALFKDPVRTAL